MMHRDLALLAAALGLPGLATAALPVAADKLTEDEALALYFPGAERFEKNVVLPPKDLVLRGRKTPLFYSRVEAYKGAELLGYALVDDVMGKARPITYFLATNADAEVLGIEVLVYRESHGHEIERAAFRDQFKGRDADDTLRLGGDIRNIAGATISCRSITDGVADLLKLLAATPKPAAVFEDVPREALDLPCDAADRLCRTRVLMNTPLGLALETAPEPGELPTRAQALDLTERAFAEVARLEELLSVFKPESDPAHLTAQAGGEPLAIAPETRRLLQAGLAIADATGGAVTPLAGPIAKAYREAAPEAPHPATLAAAVALVRHGKLTFDSKGRARLDRPGLTLDFGASGKGFALDALASALATPSDEGAAPAARGLANFGGQLLVLGDGVRHPVTLEDGTELELERGSLAVTSTSERGAHVFDARDGTPVTSDLVVTVWAPTALDADLWSSALFVLGVEEGAHLATQHGLAVHFAGAGLEAPRTTPAWRTRFPEN